MSSTFPAAYELSSIYRPTHKPSHRSWKSRCLLHVDVCHPAGLSCLSVCICSTPFRNIFRSERRFSNSYVLFQTRHFTSPAVEIKPRCYYRKAYGTVGGTCFSVLCCNLHSSYSNSCERHILLSYLWINKHFITFLWKNKSKPLVLTRESTELTEKIRSGAIPFNRGSF